MSQAYLRSIRFVSALAVAVVLTVLAIRPAQTRGPSSRAAPHSIVRVLTSYQGGFRSLADNLVVAYRRSLPQVVFDTVPGLSPAASIEAVQQGKADLAFTFADEAYLAYVGRPGAGVAPFNRLRAIADLGLTPVWFIVRPGAPIAGVPDLRGRRINVGPVGSATEVTVGLLLDAFGIRPSEITLEHLPSVEAVNYLIQGSLDAMFSDTVDPSDWISTATAAGARLLPLTGPPIERLRRKYRFFAPTRIPRGLYPGLQSDVSTIGVDSLLICSRDLDEQVVYEMTKQFFEALPTLSSGRTLRFMDVEQAPATSIPLHPGAARYYRERELMR